MGLIGRPGSNSKFSTEEEINENAYDRRNYNFELFYVTLLYLLYAAVNECV